MPQPISLPLHLYAEVAPLSIPHSEHLLLRQWRRTHADIPNLLDWLLQEVHEKRREAFEYLDIYVLNRNKTASEDLRLTSSWLRKALAVYDGGEIANSTYNSWIAKGALRLERKNKPQPDWVASTYLARMIDTGENNFLPEDHLDETEPPFWCYAQEGPAEKVTVQPLTHIDRLPSHTLLWTDWAGAAWTQGWRLIGEQEGSFGAIRFAGLRSIRGQMRYAISLDHLQMWDPQGAALYVHFPGNSFCQIHDLATFILHRLARTRLGYSTAEEKRR